jgi:Tfp pilus assembly protein PilN
VVLLAANVMLFMGYLTSSQSTRIKLAGLEREITREKRDGAVLQGNLGKLGLDQQNREVTFLNRKIAERTFSWSLLFDRMAEVLPNDVRLLRLKPANVVQRDVGLGPRPSDRELNPPPVTMTMHCEAKDDEAVLRFVDNLFAHPAFSNPNLESEERQDTGWLRFDITVQYQSNVPAGATARPPQARTSRQARGAKTAGAAGTAVPTPGGAAGTTGLSGLAGSAPAAGPGGKPAAAAVPGMPPAPGSPAGAGLVPVGPLPAPRPGSGVQRPPAGSLAPPAPLGPTVPGAPAPAPPRPPARKANPFAPGISAASAATGPPRGGSTR